MKMITRVVGGMFLLAQLCGAAEVKLSFETGDLQGWQITEGGAAS